MKTKKLKTKESARAHDTPMKNGKPKAKSAKPSTKDKKPKNKRKKCVFFLSIYH
jgi:hypothetical protein